MQPASLPRYPKELVSPLPMLKTPARWGNDKLSMPSERSGDGRRAFGSALRFPLVLLHRNFHKLRISLQKLVHCRFKVLHFVMHQISFNEEAVSVRELSLNSLCQFGQRIAIRGAEMIVNDTR